MKSLQKTLVGETTKYDGEKMIEEIASDFYRVEIPLPDTVLKFVNSYVIKDRERKSDHRYRYV